MRFFPISKESVFVPTIIAIGLLISAAALRFPALTLNSFWLDEMATVWITTIPSEYLKLRFLFFDGHAPSFNLLVRFWASLFGNSEFALRMFPALIGTITVPLCYLVFRRQLGERAAFAASILILFMPGHIYYSQELRAYSLAFLFATLSTAALLAYLEQPTEKYRWILAFTCAGLLATHYLSIFFCMIVLLIAVLGINATRPIKVQKAKQLALTTYFLTSPFIAQLLIHKHLKRASRYWELSENSIWEKFSGTVLWLFQNESTVLWIYVALNLLALLHVFRIRDGRVLKKSLAVGALVIFPVGAVLATYFITTDFLLEGRTIFVFASPVVLFAALGATAFKSRIFTGVVLVIVSAASVWWLIDSSYYTIPSKSDFRGSVQEIARIERQHGEILLVNVGQGSARKERIPAYMRVSQYYFDMFNVDSELIDIPKGSSSTQAFEFIREIIRQKNVDTLVLVSLHKPEFPEMVELCDQHFRRVSEKKLPGWYPNWTFVITYAID